MDRESSSRYNEFSRYYDLLMEDAPYSDWSKWFQRCVASRKNGSMRLADIGCGTGTLTASFCEAGFTVYAVDLSESMLAEASVKLQPYLGAERVQLLQQDVRQLTLPTTVDIAVSFCDTFSYIVDSADLQKSFKAVRRHLAPGGLFLFDMHSEHQLAEVMGTSIFCDVRDEIAYMWETAWNEQSKTCESEVTFFALEPSGLYRKFVEAHRQRAYPVEEVVSMLREVGFAKIRVTGDFREEPPTERTCRLFFECE